jgi:ADP-ribose pyrophosphatase YjhB (NUDIX family)
MRISSRGIIIKDNKVVLLHRENNGDKYYSFPGGKVEDNESDEECLIRECTEELGIKIEIKKRVYEVKGNDFLQHFFLCEWISGDLGTGDKKEYNPNRRGGKQVPMLVEIKYLENMKIISKSIIDNLLKDIENYGLELDNNVKEIIEN